MVQAMSKLLLVIDIQNDFCPGGALAVDRGHEIIAPVNGAMHNYSSVVLTQDWHPKHHSSFASQHTQKNPLDTIEMSYGSQVLWPDHCVQGSEGANFHPNLNVDRADLILRKGFNPDVDSYSAFFENDKTTPTGLHGYLQNKNITSIDLVGLATDFCVFYSAMDACKLGYSVTVLNHMTRAIDLNGSLETARKTLLEMGVTWGA